MRPPEALAWERRAGASVPVDVDALARRVAGLLAAFRALEAEDAHRRRGLAEAVADLGDPGARWPVRSDGAAVALRLAERGAWNASEVSPAEIVELVFARSGLAAAVDAVVAAASFALVHTDPPSLRARVDGGDFAGSIQGALRRLRARILAADEIEHRSAEERAEHHRGRGSAESRCAMAFLFPHRPAWARDVLASESAIGDDTLGLLLGCAIDGEDLAAIAARCSYLQGAAEDGRLGEAIRRLGPAALPTALRLVVRRPTMRTAVVAAVAPLDLPEVAEVLVVAYVDGAVRDAAREQLVRRPEAALVAVATRMATKSAEATLLQPLLAMLVHAAPERAIAACASAAKKERVALLAAGARAEMVPAIAPAVAARLDEPLGDPNAEAAWSALAAWLRAKAPRAGLGTVGAVCARCGARGTRRLAELARLLARHDGVGAALAIVDGLEANGTSLALREIARFATETTDAALGPYAEVVLRRIQARLAWTDDEMADRIVPDCGIDGASLTLDFGPRAFRAELDAELVPRLLDASGKVLKSLPRPTKKDDPTKSARATAIWTDFRARAAGEAREQARRFEMAMVTGRAYGSAVFRDVVLEHPILAGLARRIVWRTSEGATFRVAEDLTLADPEDEHFTLPAGATLRVTHPLELAPETRDSWCRVFADYEIIAPFEQLSREVHALPANTVGHLQEVLVAFVGKPAARGARQILEREDFQSSFEWSLLSFWREVRGVGTRIALSLPEPDGAPDDIVEVVVTAHARPADAYLDPADSRGDGAAVDPIGASEAIRAVRRIVSLRAR